MTGGTSNMGLGVAHSGARPEPRRSDVIAETLLAEKPPELKAGERLFRTRFPGFQFALKIERDQILGNTSVPGRHRIVAFTPVGLIGELRTAEAEVIEAIEALPEYERGDIVDGVVAYARAMAQERDQIVERMKSDPKFAAETAKQLVAQGVTGFAELLKPKPEPKSAAA